MSHVHPTEEPCIALQGPNTRFLKAHHKLVVPFLEPSPILLNVISCEGLIREHCREEMLSLRRNKSEARHFGGSGDDQVVVGVDCTNSEARETQILGEAIDDVGLVEDLVTVFELH